MHVLAEALSGDGVVSEADRQALERVRAGKIPNRHAIRRLSMSKHIVVTDRARIRLTRAGIEALTALSQNAALVRA